MAKSTLILIKAKGASILIVAKRVQYSQYNTTHYTWYSNTLEYAQLQEGKHSHCETWNGRAEHGGCDVGFRIRIRFVLEIDFKRSR